MHLFSVALKHLHDSSEFAMYIEQVTTRFPDVDQFQYGSVFVIPLRTLVARPVKWHRTDPDLERNVAIRSRLLLMANVKFRNGAEYLIAEIERVRSGDTYSVFCTRLPRVVNQTLDTQVLRIAREISERCKWPEWNHEKSVFRIGETEFPGQRLIHRKRLSDALKYARRIVGLEYAVPEEESQHNSASPSPESVQSL